MSETFIKKKYIDGNALCASLLKNLQNIYPDILETLNSFYESKKLSGSSKDHEKTSKYVIQYVFNSYNLLNSIFGSIGDDEYQFFLSNDSFRKGILTKGGILKVKVTENKKEYIFVPNTNYNFYTEASEYKNQIDLEENESVILIWPGCAFVFPENLEVTTMMNPEISFPSIFVSKNKGNDFVNIYERNWGVNVLASEPGLFTIEEDSDKEHFSTNIYNPDSTINDSSSNTVNFSHAIIQLNKLINSQKDNSEIQIQIQLPLITQRQDILTLIKTEESEEFSVLLTCP